MSEIVKNFYKKHAKHWEQQYSQVADQGSVSNNKNFCIYVLRELASDIVNPRLVDFGCGTGGMLRALRDTYTELVGIDISSDMLEVARDYVQSANVHLELASTKDYLAQPRDFDVASFFGYFVHDDLTRCLSYLKGGTNQNHTVVANFKNKLFGAFALNSRSMTLYDELISESERFFGSEAMVEDQRNYFENTVRSNPETLSGVEASTETLKEYNSVFGRDYTEEEVVDTFMTAGYEINQLIYFNPHPVVPKLYKTLNSSWSWERYLSAVKEVNTSFSKRFLCSTFLVVARSKFK